MNLEIAAVVHEWATMVAQRIQNEWDNLGGIHGEAHVETEVPVVFPSYLLSRIEAWGEKCWKVEYGSGSLSDTSDNPYLDEYISSENFNHYRSKSDMTIRGRDAGEYTDLDGNPQYSSGKNAGKNLEAKPVYRGMTMVPMHTVREQCLSALPELYSRINSMVAAEVAKELTIQTKMYVK